VGRRVDFRNHRGFFLWNTANSATLISRCRSSVWAVTACRAAYGPPDDAESIATIRYALDLGVNLLDTSASYGKGHNHRLIGEAIRGRRSDVVIHSKSGSPRDGGPDAVRGGGDPRYLRQTCEQSLVRGIISSC
jgi:aryl-alcohol dehydrogenase-like predicted oxidoreductase